jgi:hypothetical protein
MNDCGFAPLSEGKSAREEQIRAALKRQPLRNSLDIPEVKSYN